MGAREEVGIDVTARDMASDELERVGKSIRNIGDGAEAAGGKVGNASRNFQNLFDGILQGVGQQAFMQLESVAMSAIQGIIGGASDLNESMSKVGVVFGDQASEIVAFSNDSAKSFGMTQQAALEAAGTYGNLFASLKLGKQESADMSTSLVALAADLASFNNQDPEEMLLKLRAGLVGEVEPLRSVGVNLNEVVLKQKALDMGLDASGTTLSAAVKAQAAYAVIMEQTSLAQGDFARTSGGLANQQRIASASVADGLAKIGTKMLPLVTSIMPMFTVAVGAVIGVLGALVDNAPLVLGFLTPFAIAIATMVLPPMIAWAAATIAATWPLLALGAVVAAFVWAVTNNFLGLGDIVGFVFGVIEAVVKGIIGTVLNAAESIVSIIATIPSPLQEGAKAMQSTLHDMRVSVDSWGTESAASATAGAEATGGALTAGAPKVADGARDLYAPLPKAAGAARAEAKEIILLTPGDMAASLKAGASAVGTASSALAAAIKDRISPAKEAAKLEGELTGKALAKALADKDPEVHAAAEAYKVAIEERLFALKHRVPQIAESTGLSYADALADTKTKVGAAAQFGTAAAAAKWSALYDKASGWGTNTGKAYADGIQDAGGYLRKKVDAYLINAQQAMQAFSPPKQGPLKEIDKWGRNIGRTWADGLEAAGPDAANAAHGLAAAAAGPLGPLSPGSSALGASLAPYAPGGGGITIINHFGAGSVRSQDDIRDLSISIAERARLAGLTTTNSRTGSVA